jgi:N-acetylmuramoyl-L-alanine amidase
MTRFGSILSLLLALAAARPLAARGDPLGAPILWRSLPHVQSALGATNYVWDGDTLSFSNQAHQVRFFAGRRRLDVDGTAVWLNAAPGGAVPTGDWRLAAGDLDLLALALLSDAEGEPKKLHVMLDPGHGGEDDGASCAAPEVKEKDLALALALRIGASLTNAGFAVSYTRTNDTELALDERSRLARKARADLFVSVHANFASNAEASGVETYVLPLTGFPGTAEGSGVRGRQIGNRNDFQNALLGYSLHRGLAGASQAPDRGLKRQSFYVLRETCCPAVLLEVGFLSNPADVRRLLSDEWQASCTTAVAGGVLAYAKKVDGLGRALAEKRARDAAADERWKRALAERAARKSAEAAPALTPTAPSNPPPLAASARRVAPLTEAATNTPPLELTTLIKFYATGTPE